MSSASAAVSRRGVSRTDQHGRIRAPVLVAALAGVSVVAVGGTAGAHDYWLMPDVLLVPGQADVALSLHVGDGFVATQEKEMENERAHRFLHAYRDGLEDLAGKTPDRARPIARVAVLSPGGHLFALDRTPARIELDAAKFEDYLREEGLEPIIAERARRGESRKSGRERYERFLKTLVQVGSQRDTVFATPLGQTLEILPQRDPTRTDAGPLGVTVRFRGQPLPGARVELSSRTGDDIEGAIQTTGPDGSVTFPAPAEGTHMLRLVHMVRCDPCTDADWSSFWASYTFASGPALVTEVVTAPPMKAPDGPGGRPPKWPIVSAWVLAIGTAIGWGLLGRRQKAA